MNTIEIIKIKGAKWFKYSIDGVLNETIFDSRSKAFRAAKNKIQRRVLSEMRKIKKPIN